MKKFSLKRARIRVGLTQRKLAKQLGVGTQSVSNWERDAAHVPPKHFFRIAKICSLNPKNLFDSLMARNEAIMKAKAKHRALRDGG